MATVLMRRAAAAALLLSACGGGREDDIAEALPPPSYGDDESNVELWLETLEIGTRELYSARDDVAAAVSLQPGLRVADIGAGTGLYTMIFAEQVGPAGAVFAVDIEPRFLKLINQRAADLDHSNVTAVLGRSDSVTLPAGDVDVAFISDTYNYFEDPEALMATVFEALRPGGRLFIIDFDVSDDAPRNRRNQHVRVGKEALKAEVEAVGFVFDAEIAVPSLDETYMLRFRKPV